MYKRCARLVTKIAIFATTLAFIPLSAFAQESELSTSSAILKGFVQYQANYFERTVLDDFAGDLAKDNLSKIFFPQTSAAISGYGPGISGQRLLPIVRYFFTEDVNTMKEMMGCFTALAEGLDEEEGVNAFVKALKNLRDMANPQTEIPKAATDISALLGLIKDQNPDLNCAATEENFLALNEPADSRDVLIERVKVALRVEEVPEDLKSIVARAPTDNGKIKAPPTLPSIVRSKAVERIILSDTLRTEAKAVLDSAPDQQVANLDALIHTMKNAYRVLSTKQHINGYQVRVHYIFQILDTITGGDVQSGNYQRFQSGALFLASVVDAATPNGEKGSEDSRALNVQKVIEAYVDDRKAYRSKRIESTTAWVRGGGKPSLLCRSILFCGGDSIFVGSYFGAAVSYLDETGDGNKVGALRSFGPVGVEAKILSVKGWPIMLGIAPIDIGAYVTRELKDADYTPKLRDVVGWSYYVSLNNRARPYSILLGYQEDIRVTNDRKVEAIFLSVAVDLPQLKLY